MLNHAVDALAGLPTYLDGTHSAWLGSGDIADRLVRAGVAERRRVLPQRLQLSVHRQQRAVRPLDLSSASRTAQGGRRRLLQLPEPVLERRPVARQDRRAAGRVDRRRAQSLRCVERRRRRPALNTSGINLRYANMLGDVEPTARYVIDTSRNGRGPWAPPPTPILRIGATPESRSGAGTHARHRSAAAGRVPVGEDTRRVRRRVHPRSRSGR